MVVTEEHVDEAARLVARRLMVVNYLIEYAATAHMTPERQRLALANIERDLQRWGLSPKKIAKRLRLGQYNVVRKENS